MVCIVWVNMPASEASAVCFFSMLRGCLSSVSTAAHTTVLSTVVAVRVVQVAALRACVLVFLILKYWASKNLLVGGFSFVGVTVAVIPPGSATIFQLTDPAQGRRC